MLRLTTFEVELSCIRKPFREGHFVSVQLAGQDSVGSMHRVGL